MLQKVRAKCDSCKKSMLCDSISMTNRVVTKNGEPKFYCYKCCYKINKCSAQVCPKCCDYEFCNGKFKSEYLKWLENIKGV